MDIISHGYSLTFAKGHFIFKFKSCCFFSKTVGLFDFKLSKKKQQKKRDIFCVYKMLTKDGHMNVLLLQ